MNSILEKFYVNLNLSVIKLVEIFKNSFHLVYMCKMFLFNAMNHDEGVLIVGNVSSYQTFLLGCF